MSPRPCGAFVEERHDSRSGDIAGFQPIDSKTSIGKQIIDLTVQVTPAREPHPERIEAILPTRYAGFRRAATLHEQQTSADFDHASRCHSAGPTLCTAASAHPPP